MHNKSSCVLLADKHHGLRDGVRGLLETKFETVFMVADEVSLLEGAARLMPAVVVIDLSLSAGDLGGLRARATARAPGAKILLLSVQRSDRGRIRAPRWRGRRDTEAQLGIRPDDRSGCSSRGRALPLARDHQMKSLAYRSLQLRQSHLRLFGRKHANEMRNLSHRGRRPADHRERWWKRRNRGNEDDDIRPRCGGGSEVSSGEQASSPKPLASFQHYQSEATEH